METEKREVIFIFTSAALKNSENSAKGPTYFEDLTEHIDNMEPCFPFEWRRKLRAKNGNTKFQIKYYGELSGDTIVATPFAPQKVLAVDTIADQEILLFDGCLHGYNAMFGDTYTILERNNRPAEVFYCSRNGETIFEVIISAYYQVDFKEEFSGDLDENGRIELINREKISFEELERDAFDVLQIILLDDKNRKHELISEELA